MITTYEQRKRIVELGFGSPIAEINKYDFVLSVSDALQWIREKYNVICAVVLTSDKTYPYVGCIIENNEVLNRHTEDIYSTFPEAESALLDLVLTYLEQKR